MASMCLRDAISGTTPPYSLCSSTCEEMQSVSTSRPSRTMATAVSSQEDSIARMFMPLSPF